MDRVKVKEENVCRRLTWAIALLFLLAYWDLSR